MEREAPISFWMPPARFAFLNKSLGTFLDRKACLKLLDAPLASLAALARSLRSPHRGEFSFIFHYLFEFVLIFEVVSVLARLGASWSRLGAVLAFKRNLI